MSCICFLTFMFKCSITFLPALLSLYLRNALFLPENESTVVYHVFIMLCFTVPVLGAITADGWLGRFRTILLFSVICTLGHIFTFLGATPILNATYVVRLIQNLKSLILLKNVDYGWFDFDGSGSGWCKAMRNSLWRWPISSSPTAAPAETIFLPFLFYRQFRRACGNACDSLTPPSGFVFRKRILLFPSVRRGGCPGCIQLRWVIRPLTHKPMLFQSSF